MLVCFHVRAILAKGGLSTRVLAQRTQPDSADTLAAASVLVYLLYEEDTGCSGAAARRARSVSENGPSRAREEALL